MSSEKDDVTQGFLTKQKGHKHVKKVHEKSENVEESRHLKANFKKHLEEIELEELEHDDTDGEDYSRYIH